jgi:filamentous hemagglutinin family protein
MKLGSNRTAGERQRPVVLRWIDRLGESRLFRITVCAFVARGQLYGGDILRGNAGASSTSSASSASSSPGANPTPVTKMVTNAQDRLARTTQALAAVRAMQTAARAAATSGANNLGLNPNRPTVQLPDVPDGLGAGGLQVATDAGNNAVLWQGAKAPVRSASGNQTTVTVTQSQQQALLQWQSFNIGKNTTLSFDQSAGGANAGEWIAFNYVRDPTGNPTQILGALKTTGVPDAKGNPQIGGQVYVMNSNGIIFGGSSQVNAHALVASSLPIDYNLIKQGLLNNPDAQFLFSALPQAAGKNGTAAFDPNSPAPDGSAPAQTPYTSDGRYGDVVVQPGAQLTAPTNANYVGGRIALVGANVTNAGTISTADGQTILAAGLQVGFGAHNSNDATLRGLDVYVGKVADASLPNQPTSGVATNAGLDATNLGVVLSGASNAATNPNNLDILGLIEAPRGDVYITGKTVNQSGVIDSSTSVSYNGRVDLVAAFNAEPNPEFGISTSPRKSLPFVFQSSTGDDPVLGASVQNSGGITLGKDSVLQILPDTTSTDRVVGDLALPSQVNFEGQSVYFASNSTLLAPGAAAPPSKPAYGIDGVALSAGVTIRAGDWVYDNTTSIQDYEFVHSSDAQQIYLDENAVLNVGGMTDVSASIGENIVSVQLRGSELANSPLQRNGPLRGQTIEVDLRQHGSWDPTLNGGLGGYIWVGTPLADTSGWVGLTTHSIGELTVNGGSVALQAGGAVVLQSGSTVNVSGGYINYQGGFTQTTQLMGADGHVYSIANASPNIQYSGIYTGTTASTDTKWGVTSSSSSPLAQSTGTYETGYIQGGNGGSLSITAPAVAFDGTLLGNTVAGRMQQTLSPVYSPGSPPDPANPKMAGVSGWLLGALNLPEPSQLSITFGRQYFRADPSPPTGTDYFAYSPTPPGIVFTEPSSSIAKTSAEPFDPSGGYQFATQGNYELDLPSDLTSNTASGSGFGVLRFDDSANNAIYDVTGNNQVTGIRFGTVSVAKDVTLNLPAGGSLSLSAGNITVGDNASVSAPGGAISLKAYDLSSNTAAELALLNSQNQITASNLPVYSSLEGNLTVGNGAFLSVAGETMDNRPAAQASPGASAVTNGGTITLAGNEVSLAGSSVSSSGALLEASTLDVSGGAVISGTGKFTYGKGGNIQISAGKTVGGGFGSVLGGALDIGAELKGYAGVGQNGGSLVLQVPAISIQSLTGGAKALTDPITGALELAPEFLSAGGFSTFNLTGLGFAVGADGQQAGAVPAFDITSGTLLQPLVQNWQSLPGGPVYTALPGLRKPANLTFSAGDLLLNLNGGKLGNDTTLVLDANAAIATDPLGSVTLNGDSIDVLGTVTAPGGNITIFRTGVNQAAPYTPTVHFGPASMLDASGTITYVADANGYHAANVVDGGKITISGSIVAEGAGVVKDAKGDTVFDASGQPVQGGGAGFNVSGVDGTVQLLPGQIPAGSPAHVGLVSTEQQSSGGSLTFAADNELFVAGDARLLGGPGQPADGGASTVQGGDLVILSKAESSQVLPTDDLLDVAQQAPVFHYSGLGQRVTDSTGQPYGDAQGLGLTWFGVDSFTRGQFGALTLSTSKAGSIQVDGAVSISANRQISIANEGVLSFATGATPSSLTLSAPYVVLGTTFQAPTASGPVNIIGANVAPKAGAGRLSVEAGTLIDVGELSLQNASAVTLDATYQGQTGATNGSIRGDGTLDVAGAITLKAGQIYPPTETTFNVIASDYTDYASNPAGTTVLGSVTIQSSGLSAAPSLPLSAGGKLNIYASVIDQGGVLRAPLGTINLGVGAGGGVDVLSGQNVPTTSKLTLLPGSITSVSAVDPATGGVTIPYGITVNGSTWIDPSGADITNLGPAAKSITFNANTINLQAASSGQPAASVDLQGGGDFSAYQFVSGTGGTVDILAGATSGSFAVIPTFKDVVAPYAPYATDSAAQVNLGSDAGYTVANPKLNYQAGDRVYLDGGDGLPAGTYTLLPARYATLPGAYLVTPLAGTATAGAAASVANPDGSAVVAGYRFNGLDQAGGDTQFIFSSFQVASQSVVLQRAQYNVSTAGEFFTNQSTANNTVAPRLPVDAGQLVLEAGSSLSLQGTILATAPTGGRGGLIDISSPADILIGSKSVIASSESASTEANTLFLDAAELSSFGAESLLVGGVRTTGAGATQVKTVAENVTVDNSGEALTGSDVILVANKDLTVMPGADVHSSGALSSPVDVLSIPDDGVLLRVSGDPTTRVARSDVTPSAVPQMAVGAGAVIAGSSVILDSSNEVSIDGTARISGQSVALDSGRISLQLDNAGTLLPTPGLVLTGNTLGTLLDSVQSLSLLSYSTIDFYGSGRVGGVDSAGQPALASLSLHAGAIRGFTNSSDPTAGVTLAAQNITLDNSANVAASAPSGTTAGTLTFDARTVDLGSNQLEIQNYASVMMNASNGVLAGDSSVLSAKTGGLSVIGGDLTIKTPLIAGAVATSQSIAADGKLLILSSSGTATVTPGFGASLSLTGGSVELDSAVKLPSGILDVDARTGDLNVAGGTLDVSGGAQSFFDVTKYTNGGQISLLADRGNIAIASGSKVSVAADAGGGSAGTLAVSAPVGTFAVAVDTLSGYAGAAGQGGAFNLDTQGLPGADSKASHLATLGQTLLDGGFDGSIALRVRGGDVVADGTLRAHDISIAADHGSVVVTGTMDASGLSPSNPNQPAADPTGGQIDVSASGNVVLAPTAALTAVGYCYDNAGKGGAISLSAGSYTGRVDTTAAVEVQAGATIDLGVKNQFTTEDMALDPGAIPPASTRTDLATGTLHLRESQAAFGTGAQFDAIGSSVNGASSIVLEGFQVFDLAGASGTVSTTGAITSIGTGGLINSVVEDAVKTNGADFVANVAKANPGLVGSALIHVQPGAEIVNTTPASNTVTNQFVVLNKSGIEGGSTLGVTINAGATVTINLAGPMPSGDSLRFTDPSTSGTTCMVTYADGSTKTFRANRTIPALSSTGQPVIAFSFVNTSSVTATGELVFMAGATPVVFAMGAPANAPVFTTTNAASYAVHAGDLALATTWDLAADRFGPNLEPGNLTMRAPGNLVFGFDASLSDGFNPANAVDPNNPLWTASLMTGPSWSYSLVAGTDYNAASPLSVQSLGTLSGASGSVLVGLGGIALPTATDSSVTSASIIPQFYQTIRTGTGDITISAGRDVQLLDPLATIYTAGAQAADLPRFQLPDLGATAYPASYSQNGGNVTIQAQGDIVRYLQSSTGDLVASSSLELPNNWLYRRGHVDSNGDFAALTVNSQFTTEIQSTSWWVDFSNFFDDVGALGGGNVILAAGHDVSNVNASVSTNARMPGTDSAGNAIKPDAAALVELGGGDLSVRAGADIDGGVYYVERGDAVLQAGGSIHSNPTRSVFPVGTIASNPVQWLPTTFFLGKGSIDVVANGDILLGPVANTFLLPQSANNDDFERTFFSTYDTSDSVNVSSLGGTITIHGNTDGIGPLLDSWYLNVLGGTLTGYGTSQPWLRALDFGGDTSIIAPFDQVAALMPATLRATAFSNDINLVGSETLAPSPTGTLDLLTSGNINGLTVNLEQGPSLSWGTAAINLSDAAPTSLPGVGSPLSFDQYLTSTSNAIVFQLDSLLTQVNQALAESGGTNLTLAERLARHGTVLDSHGNLEPLHYDDPDPMHLYAVGGDISGLTFYSGKPAEIVAGHDITDIAFYIQNVRPGDVSLVAASHDIIAYDPSTPLRNAAQQPGNVLSLIPGETGAASADPDAGDIQIAGPGAIEVLAGRNLDLGSGNNLTQDGTAAGITSIGSIRNPYLPQNSGANIVATAGTGSVYTPVAAALSLTPGLASTGLGFADFINEFLNPATAGAEAARYLPELATLMDVASTNPSQIWAAFGFQPGQPLTERQALLIQDIFQLVLRNSARDRNDISSADFGTYKDGLAAITALFPGSPQPTEADLKSTVPVVRPAGPWTGEISLPTREIKTFEGGNITVLAPGGDIAVGRATDPQTPDQGIITERGGNVSIFAADSIIVGTSRIFTLLGGNEIVWSTWGNIAAGSGSKTVYSAPPTRVLIDPQSGDVQNDLAGLATGSGIGVLATLQGVEPGNVDLIAPVGTIDAGDAGIRASGNLNLAARVVLNASNIQVGGSSAGAPPPPAAPNFAPLTASSTASAAATSEAASVAKQETAQSQNQAAEVPSIITVEILGYGGGDDSGSDKDERRDQESGSL